MSFPLLILRPEPGASKTAVLAQKMGLNPIIAPLFAMEPVAWDAGDPAGYSALMITSANAVRLAGAELSKLKALPTVAVGEATAEAARAAELHVALTGDSGVDALVAQSVEHGFKNLLWLAGEAHTAITAGAAKIDVRIVYRAVPLNPDLPGPAIALLHSAEAARRFRSLCELRTNQFDLVAMSAPVADAAGPGWRSLSIAPKPSDQAMLEIAKSMCQSMIDD